MLQPAQPPEWDQQRADLARHRHVARLARLERDRREKEARLRKQAVAKTAAVPSQDELKQAIQAAVARVRAKKAVLVARDTKAAALPPPDPPAAPDH